MLKKVKERKTKADPAPVRIQKESRKKGPERDKREGRQEKNKRTQKVKNPQSHAVPACSPVTLLPPPAFGVGVEKEKRYEMTYAHVER
jgi:hypothetical protein